MTTSDSHYEGLLLAGSRMAYPIFPCSRYSYSSGLAKAASPRNSNRRSFLLVSFHHRLKEFLPAIGTMHVSGS